MKNTIRGVLFDFNGTMVFDEPQHLAAWNILSNELRQKPISEIELAKMHGQINAAIFSMLLGREISASQSKELSLRKEAIYRQICTNLKEEYQLVVGLPALLDRLKKRQIPMTIVSASIEDNMNFFIERFQLERWFDRSCIVFDDGHHIDKRTMFIEGARRIALPIEQCLIIEDSHSGIRHAQAVHPGAIIAIATKEKQEEYSAFNVDAIVSDYREFDDAALIKG